MATERFLATIEISDSSRWPDGTSGLVNWVHSELNDEENSLIKEILWRSLADVGISVLKCESVSQNG